MEPENPQRLPRDPQKGQESPFYQLGAILYELLTRHPLFWKTPDKKLTEAVRDQQPSLQKVEVGGSSDLVELAKDCLTKDWRKRLQVVSWARFGQESIPEHSQPLRSPFPTTSIASGGRASCFIAASANSDTLGLREVLRKLHVHHFDAFDFTPGESIPDAITNRIEKADFILALLDEPNANVLFEVGVAVGLKKPVLIIAHPKSDPPSALSGCLVLRASLKDHALLQRSISRFVDDSLSRKRTRKPKPPAKTTTLRVSQSTLAEFVQLRATGKSLLVERLALDLLSSLGLQVVVAPPGPDTGVDCVVWHESLTHALGNPILVQVKAGDLNLRAIKEAEERLTALIAESDARSAILLYLDKDGQRFDDRFSLSPLVIRCDLEDFAHQLRDAPFEEVLLVARNRMVHGIR